MLGVNCRQVLLYNLGLQQLHAGQPTVAFASLLEAVQVFHTNPLLWLRLAETSIAAYNKVVVIVILLYIIGLLVGTEGLCNATALP